MLVRIEVFSAVVSLGGSMQLPGASRDVIDCAM